MSQATRRTYSGTPLWSMKSRANRSTVAGSLPGVTLMTSCSTRPATTVMQLRPPRPVPSMPTASTPMWSSSLLASSTQWATDRHKRVSVSSTCSASVPAGRWRAISTAHASNRSVNPPPGLAHGAGTVLTPCSGHVTRGMAAWMNALYRKKSGCRHTRPRLSCTGQASSRQPVSGQWKRAPGSKTIMMRSSRRPPSASRKPTDPTFQGDCNRSAAVNR
ncbi:hypothetical protein BIFLH23_02070 [Bifidobacterium longum subsp. infantis]|uniref:Uncharacterized protein n=1 Tax=Bifidobacterium longum subsp. infantis TaxID=1682 RepID=A0A8U0LII9_BIFLI|nr:hypothetical protein BIFLH23_02070 [Bifidobacterium longum subsp. infantis]